MYIPREMIRALNKTSLSEAIQEFFEVTGRAPHHILVSKPYQALGKELAQAEDSLLCFVSTLPLGAWILCSDDAIYIGGEQHGKHTIIMWKE